MDITHDPFRGMDAGSLAEILRLSDMSGIIFLRNCGRKAGGMPAGSCTVRNRCQTRPETAPLAPTAQYAKKPFTGPKQVLQYLSRYTHLVIALGFLQNFLDGLARKRKWIGVIDIPRHRHSRPDTPRRTAAGSLASARLENVVL